MQLLLGSPVGGDTQGNTHGYVIEGPTLKGQGNPLDIAFNMVAVVYKCYGRCYDEIEQTMLSNSEGLTVEQPSRGELDVSGIRDSEYFFA